VIASNPLLRFRSVGKTFVTAAGSRPVLKDVNLDIAAGEFTVVSGPSGSGKSTLLNLAGLLDRPTEGEIWFDGKQTSAMNERTSSDLRANHVGMVFQSFHLLPHRSLLDNVLFRFRYTRTERGEAIARAVEALAKVGLSDRARQPARLLSGGEMQRAAIARAVCLRPALLLADEPTGNLDRRSAEEVMSHFLQLNAEGLCIVLVTHNESLWRYGSRRLSCSDGAIGEAV
jgi:putative ABC transport system ATP-binding protein